MNLTSEQIKVVLHVAKMLQGQYEAIGAPATQNIRNHQPMHRIVTCLLPNSKYAALSASQIHDKIVSLGFRAPRSYVNHTLTMLKKSKKIQGFIAKPEQVAEIKRNRSEKRGGSMANLYYVRG